MNSPKHKILVVEDDEIFRKLLALIFTREGWEVITANSGRQGLERLKENGSFSVITSDNRMPDMSGIDFLKNASQIAPDSLRIMISGTKKNDLKEHFPDDQHFLFGFHEKPASLVGILKTLQRAVRFREEQMCPPSRRKTT